jgi:hypothetical protein
MQGSQYSVRVHTDATNRIVFDGMTVKYFSHDSSFVTAVTVVKVDDYPAGHLDGYVVQTSYPEGTEPATSTPLSTYIADAVVAIQAVVPGGVGGGTPSVDPSL